MTKKYDFKQGRDYEVFFSKTYTKNNVFSGKAVKGSTALCP